MCVFIKAARLDSLVPTESVFLGITVGIWNLP